MKLIVLSNVLVFAALLAVPLIAEAATASGGQVPGTGFDVLFYEPFDYAYVCLATFLFVALNAYIASKKSMSVWIGAGVGVLLSVVWFAVSFLSVVNLHLSLGGKL